MPLWAPTNAISRPAYYDRNPTSALASYENSLAGHAAATRWSYTVPAAKAAFIESLESAMTRIAAGAPSALAFDRINYTPSGGAATTIMINLDYDVGSGVIAQIVMTSWGYMGPGDTISYVTQDTSTGGLIFHLGAFKGVEFLK